MLATDLPFIFAVLVASVAGSLHCVGMCGGLMLAVSAPKKRWFYHVGRGVSYATIGLLAGFLGSGLYHSGLSTSLKLVSVIVSKNSAEFGALSWAVSRAHSIGAEKFFCRCRFWFFALRLAL